MFWVKRRFSTGTDVFKVFKAVLQMIYSGEVVSVRILDNSDGKRVVDVVKEELKKTKEAKFAVGYFFLSGYQLVKEDFPEHMEKTPFLKIVMGKETTLPTKEELVEGYKLREEMKQRLLEDLQKIRDNENAKQRILELRELIASNKVEVKLFDKSRLHAKLYLFLTRPEEKLESPGLAIIGSSNFTAEGLTKNKELNVMLTSTGEVNYLNKWFDQLWGEAEDFNEDLLKVMDWAGVTPEGQRKYPAIGTYVDPKTLFKYLVYQWFGDRILKLTKKDVLLEFQVVGVLNAADKINKYNGVIIADSVGLGKSYIAAALMEEFLLGKHKSWIPKGKKELGVLYILPPSIIPQWEKLLFSEGGPFLKDFKVAKEEKGNRRVYRVLTKDGVVVGKVELMSLGLFQLAKGNRELERMAEKYDLIIIDEAHKYRNRETKRWNSVRKLQCKKDGHHNKFILLTATPLNNSIGDLVNLINLFMNETYPPFALKNVDVRGLFSKYNRLKKELKENKDDTKEKELKKVATEIKEKILDEIMILRTRKYIQEKFKDIKINGKPLVFRDPKTYVVDYSPFFDKAYRWLIDQVKEKLDKIEFEYTKLYGCKMIAFKDQTFADKEEVHYVPVSELFKLLLSKRLESSIFSFELTLRRIYKKEEIFYEVFKKYVNCTGIEQFAEPLKQALEKAKISKEIVEVIDEFGTDIEANGESVLDRIARGFIEKGEARIGKDATEEDKFRAGLEGTLETLEKDLELLEDLLKICDNLKEKTIGTFPKNEGDIEEIPVWKYKSDPKMDVLFQILDCHKQRMSSKLKCENLCGKKVVIFTQYKDTAYYIHRNLCEWVENNPDVMRWLKEKGRLKIGLVTGESGFDTKVNYIKRFAPNANDGSNEVARSGEIEILIATDTLGEGVNLQDGDAVINFDLPWNPMQIVQRVGRVNRLGNDKEVIVENFVPHEELEVLVGVLQKLKDKISDISQIIGKETAILMPDETINVETFGEKIKEVAQASPEELEEMGQDEGFKDIMPNAMMNEKDIEEYKLLNLVQYDLGWSSEDFEEVVKMNDPPYYSFVKGGRLVSLYSLERGGYEVEKKIVELVNGEIKEAGLLVLKDLIVQREVAPHYDDRLMEGLKRVKELVKERAEMVREEGGKRIGFLKKLEEELILEKSCVDDTIRGKWVQIVTSLKPISYYRNHSMEIKKFLLENNLIKTDSKNNIKIIDLRKLINELYMFLKKKGLLSIPDLKVKEKIWGWYCG